MKKDLTQLLSKHQSHITTVRYWNEYAKRNSLPSAATLIRAFGSWGEVKKQFGEMNYSLVHSENDLMKVAEENVDYFTTIKYWNSYSQAHSLPSSTKYINQFGSWSLSKDRIGIKANYRRSKYSHQQLKDIIISNKEFLYSKIAWDEHAKEYNLPTYLTLKKYISWKEIKELAGQPFRYNYTKEELIQIARKNREHFSSMNKWDEYAREHTLPLSTTYSKHFGSWRKAKGKCLC
ncbi:hypothetical protein VBD025_00820 [Virgibacillus flavescens]|uniref:hypothetical protein n=1 Tax=Virgibacillus flavescens TaxID=1611422 RepID=UPI003D359335